VSGDASDAALVIIGNEILSGRTIDQNLPMVGAGLARLGIPLREVRVVADDADAIVEAVNACRARYRYVFTTGGIGPTHDDITAAAIARAFGRTLDRHPEALARLEAQYGETLNPARARMADMPEGAELVENIVSQAPGFRVENVYVLAGVPMIAKAMFEAIAPALARGRPILSVTVEAGAREGEIAEPLAAIAAHHPAVEIGSYPFFRRDRFGVSLVIRGSDEKALETAARAVENLLLERGFEPRRTG
jgi:molybdenum cofactor synthesis domain-containing protein